jgi:hypothetical protein
MKPASQEVIGEARQSLWLLTISPAIWAAHFMVSYIGAAIWCGKITERTGGLGWVRIGIVVLALVALVGIGITGLVGWRKHKYGEGQLPYDRDTPEDRRRFLGFATVLLSGLSAVATIYVALVALFIRDCL